MQLRSITYLVLFVFSSIIVGVVAQQFRMANNRPSMENLNVLNKPLALFSRQPLTGFYRDGYCRVGPDDQGKHAIAAVVTDRFLDFSASRGNDLRSIGLTEGCKWCLCVSRWREALQAAKSPDDPVVPKVFLHATDKKALEGVSLEDLKKFAAEGEIKSYVDPETKSGGRGMAKETH